MSTPQNPAPSLEAVGAAAASAGKRPSVIAGRWAVVGAAMLVQIGIWLGLLHLVYLGNHSSSAASSSGPTSIDDWLAFAIGLAILLFALVGPSAAATAFAPIQPLLTGSITAALPILVATAEHARRTGEITSAHAVNVVCIASAFSLILGVVPTVAIRRRLESNRRRASKSAAQPYWQTGKTSISDSVWPPPPSA